MKLGLCFSGGGIKGAAHIGVLKALEEEKIKIDFISGTSSGSIIATMYAIGYKPEEIYFLIKKYAKEINYIGINNIIKLIYGIIIKHKINITCLNDGKKLRKIIKKLCEEKNVKNMSDIKMPLLIPSVDLNNGDVHIFTSHIYRKEYSDKIIYENNVEIDLAVCASCAYPGIFSPVNYKKTQLIDGGIRENIPWKETKMIGADKVISVVFDKKMEENNDKNIFDIISESISLLSRELSIYELIGADYLIRINTKEISLLDNTKIDELYNMGYKETKKNINKIKKIITH